MKLFNRPNQIWNYCCPRQRFQNRLESVTKARFFKILTWKYTRTKKGTYMIVESNKHTRKNKTLIVN